MRRAGIITFLHNNNYGSSLQAYALQRTLLETGMDCIHLDYRPDPAEKVHNMLQCGNHPRLILEGLKKKKLIVSREGAREKQNSFPAFYRDHLRLSAPCRNLRELASQSADLDILICGSDQIWNPIWLNPAYFLTFAPEKALKIAYAPSLGVRMNPSAKKAGMIRRWISDFDAVSVREREGADLIESITGVRPDVMPDPVCLLSGKEWEDLASPAPSGPPYLLCYLIGDHDHYAAEISRIQKETGLRVLEIPVNAGGYRRGFELLEGLSPTAFLGAVRGSACFCTDSFHGLVFGTIFAVRTEVLRRDRDTDPENKNSRIDHFLRTMQSNTPDDLRRDGRAWLHDHLTKEQEHV